MFINAIPSVNFHPPEALTILCQSTEKSWFYHNLGTWQSLMRTRPGTSRSRQIAPDWRNP